ncbi:betaine--homocysteine S-methyltransferase [Loktanella sp. F6476L]|uniref:betaine--homocysteine S-methyltransferase n=1 Tax=Loktanella sp. F6476L TaxID=2926405 RepID=UPI001FF12712|nr:betaine--homocysteine S-methyltransferase [Loktanella sp. F6476L]MCK0121492.1 betaine--homocysteine S-methyltransferase [Loktanella sp. F6476L]
MTNTAFATLLSERDWLLADGATGTNLFNMGLEAGDPPEFWNVDHPDRIKALYEGAAHAGSDIFLTNTFGGNASRLKLHNAQDRVFELNKVGAELGRDVADAMDRKVIVAGSVGPTGDIMKDMGGTLTHELAVEMFHAQAEGLKAGGADLLWVETISAAEEYKAASEAFAMADMPWCGTMSFDTAGRTMMGITSSAMTKMVGKLENAPLAFGANCGVGASDLLRTILGLSINAPFPLIAKGNAGIPKFHDGHIHYDGTPELMADYATLARDCGAKIIGGCCGTTPEHLRSMREALETRPKGETPSLEAISAALGGFSSESDGTDGAGPVRAARRGRRRA